MINSRYKLYAVTSLLSFILFILVALLTSFGFSYKLVIGSIIYFATTYAGLKYLRSINPIVLLQLVTIPVILTILFFNIVDFKSTWISAPSNIFLLLSSYASYFFYKTKMYLIPVSLCLMAFIWLVKGEKIFSNVMQFGSYNGLIEEKLPAFAMYDNQGEFSNPLNTSKVVILDFWNSHCAPCFAQFPLIDSISKTIDTSKFWLAVVNVPLNGERKEDNYKLLSGFNYNFNQLFAFDSSILDSFKIQYYPTTLVLRQNAIVFRGDFLEALQYLKIK